jgi:hypothetical protein
MWDQSMKFAIFRSGLLRKILCIVMALVMASAPSVTAVAQGYGAIQAVRQRVSGLEQAPGSQGPDAHASPEGTPATPPTSSELVSGKLDTTYVSPTAAVIAVLRPAQLIGSPLGQVLPVEVASAAGLKYLGVDPVDIDEVVAFLDLANPMMPAYGVTIKFNKPFRAIAIPAERRVHAKLADLNGKKYLKSAHPMLPSFYGPNNKTLILAPDAVMEKIVMSATQPKSGTLIDRTREVPAGSDLYVAVDMVPIRPLLQMGMAQAQAKMPPEAKQYVDSLNLIAAAELTLNVVTTGNTSLVLHANDDTAAQQLETMMLEARQKMQTAEAATAPPDDPIQQAMVRYKDRLARPFQPVRNGTSITCIQIDGQDPAQRELVKTAFIAGLTVAAMPAIQAARNAAMRAQAGAPGTGPEGAPGPTGPEGAVPTSPEGTPPPGGPGGGVERR